MDSKLGPAVNSDGMRCSDKWFLPMSLDDDFKLLDWTGRQIVRGVTVHGLKKRDRHNDNHAGACQSTSNTGIATRILDHCNQYGFPTTPLAEGKYYLGNHPTIPFRGFVFRSFVIILYRFRVNERAVTLSRLKHTDLPSELARDFADVDGIEGITKGRKTKTRKEWRTLLTIPPPLAGQSRDNMTFPTGYAALHPWRHSTAPLELRSIEP